VQNVNTFDTLNILASNLRAKLKRQEAAASATKDQLVEIERIQATQLTLDDEKKAGKKN